MEEIGQIEQMGETGQIEHIEQIEQIWRKGQMEGRRQLEQKTHIRHIERVGHTGHYITDCQGRAWKK